jgi:uncharacterized protein (TIGR03000 family)
MRPLMAVLVLVSTQSLALCTTQDKPKQVQTKLTVLVPLDDATLLIEGQKTSQDGTKRVFDIPPLEAGKKYTYTFEVKWEPNNYTKLTRKRSIEFTAGDNLTVDLTREQPDDRATIRYVPTPEDIVEKLLELAKVNKDDVVYEPGCGDARMVCTAVKKGAKRGVGIDLDPERITEAKETVKKMGVEGKVELRLGDALDIKDLDQATLVLLYMGNEFDMLIRPHLWRQLKVGARVASHRFLMGDWKPDQSIKVTGADGDEYELHVWTVTEAVKKRAAELEKNKPAGEKK